MILRFSRHHTTILFCRALHNAAVFVHLNNGYVYIILQMPRYDGGTTHSGIILKGAN